MSRQRVVSFLSGTMQIDLRRELEVLKAKGAESRKQKDLLWRKLCEVVATTGSVVHANEFMAMYEDRLAFDKLSTSEPERTHDIFRALEEANVPRWRQIKAQHLSANYELVNQLGGPVDATIEMLKQEGRQSKMQWLLQFHGVGAKYSRNIWMDICDPDFCNSIALDARVKTFAEKLGFDRNSNTLEADLLEFAKSCKLNGWEFDRLVFNFGDLILQQSR